MPGRVGSGPPKSALLKLEITQMDVFETIKKRYSVRSFQQKSVPEKTLEKILEAGRLAPSAHNAQDWKFIVVQDERTKQSLGEAAGQNFITEAPIVIAAVSTNPKHILSSGNPAYAIDLAIATEHMMLAATDEGLGTCWIGAFDQQGCKKILDVPDKYKILALFPLGYPADQPSPKDRKPLKEIISYEKFS